MKKKLLLPLFLANAFLTNAQNIGIGTDSPHPSALLEIYSDSKGILVPSMRSGARNLISSPATGLLVFDKDTKSFWFWTGIVWQNISPLNSSWALPGNSGTSASTHFIGTTDNNSLMFKVNNQKAGYIGIEANDGNAFWGYQSGSNNIGYSNVAIGIKALFNNTVSSNLVAIGDSALFNNTGQAKENTAIGSKSMFSNTTGYYNTAVGYRALYSNTIGRFNTAIGFQALYNNTIMDDNTAIGYQVLYNNTIGYSNTANGGSALFSNTEGFYNTAIGASALVNNTTGAHNTANGLSGLFRNTTGNFNTTLGSLADVSIGSLDYATAIGFGALVNASNKVRIGGTTVTVIEGQVPFSSPSDGRYKFNIRNDVSGLDFIMRLRPITYQFDVKRFDENLRSSLSGKENYNVIEASYKEASAIRRTGFIAQEVEKAASETGYEFSGLIKPKSEKEYYGLSYESFVGPLVKGMQEQQLEITAQNKKIEDLEKKLAEMQKQMEELTRLIHK